MHTSSVSRWDRELSLPGADAAPQIPVAFDDTSVGQLSLVIYEWQDAGYLGAETPDAGVGSSDLPVSYLKQWRV